MEGNGADKTLMNVETKKNNISDMSYLAAQ
jgi:hypothetical protein